MVAAVHDEIDAGVIGIVHGAENSFVLVTDKPAIEPCPVDRSDIRVGPRFQGFGRILRAWTKTVESAPAIRVSLPSW
jgi:hypothetical protein